VAAFLKKCLQVQETQRKNEIDNPIEVSDDEMAENDDKKPAKKASEDYPALVRPIIFVCNDGFAKQLYPLKDSCLRLKVLSCSVERITERVTEIL